MNRLRATCRRPGWAASIALLALGSTGCGSPKAGATESGAPDSIAAVAAEAYLFAYPLVVMDVTRQAMTAVPKADAHKAPVNQFVHAEAFPDSTFTDVVSPNADTLYSFAWLDLEREPMVLSVPEMGKRYYIMQLLSAWTDVFASPGSRTTGNGAGDFLLVGPGWNGSLPAGVQKLASPTNLVWLIGRTQTNGKADYGAVHEIQKQYKLTPLSAWKTDYTAPTDVPVAAGVDSKTPPPEQVARMDAATFFGRFNALLQHNPPSAADAPAMARFAALGIAAGRPFDLAGLDPALAAGVQQGLRDGQAKLLAEAKKPHGRRVNGWDVLPDNTANFGTDYTWRAVVALVGLGANLPIDAVYPHATVDGSGQPLSGANRYVVRFAKGQTPPVQAFWSITLYNAKQNFVQNPIDRYAIGDRDALQLDPDGTLTLYIQHESPGEDKQSNWLPAPADAFNLFMRLYWPEPAILDGTWKMPPVERAR